MAYRIGGGGSEKWMIIVPVLVAVVVVTTVMGGPSNALSAMEHIAYDLVDVVSIMLRR